MGPRDVCRREIEELHAFFVDWYDGVVDEDAFARMDAVIGEGFQMVTPAGQIYDRGAVLAMVRDGYGKTAHEGFDIQIRNLELVRDFGEAAVVRYEEYQLSGMDGSDTEKDGRVSPVLTPVVRRSGRGRPGPRRTRRPSG